ERLGFACDPNGPSPVIEGFNSLVSSSWQTIKKSGSLAPGAASIYRFTNCAARTYLTYRKVRMDLTALKAASPPAFRRIMVPLRECWDHVGAVTSGGVRNKEAGLKHIHRALLTLAHAQSLARNFTSEGAAGSKTARPLSNDLDGLQKSLTSLSMVLLELVPGATVSAPDSADPMVRQVTVSMANAGSRSVSFVRLGAAAPSGC